MAPPSDGWKDFWSLTQDALDFSMRRYGIENPALRLKLLDAYLTLDAFPEVRTVLESLKEAGLRTAIISNGTETMLRSAMSSARIESLIDEIVSADEVRVFKPSPKLYHRVVDRLEVEKEEVLFHSSNAWDAAAAGSFGFKVARIERSKQPKEYEFVPVSIECANLSGIPEAVAPR
jgi:2-haloacid dehalogenase